MATPDETAAPAASAESAPGKRRAGRGKGGGREGGKRAMNMVAINRRVEALAKLEDTKKKKQGRARLIRNILSGIATGSIKQPDKAAEAILALMPKKGGRKAAAAEAE